LVRHPLYLPFANLFRINIPLFYINIGLKWVFRSMSIHNKNLLILNLNKINKNKKLKFRITINNVDFHANIIWRWYR
jgi:hypothetical protein